LIYGPSGRCPIMDLTLFFNIASIPTYFQDKYSFRSEAFGSTHRSSRRTYPESDWRFSIYTEASRSPSILISYILYKSGAATWTKPQTTSCHQHIVFGAPRLSSWWMATSTWSEAIFVTWIEVPPPQILILSISSKVQLPDNRPLRLRVCFSFVFWSFRSTDL
jgi:hypothetical protein